MFLSLIYLMGALFDLYAFLSMAIKLLFTGKKWFFKTIHKSCLNEGVFIQDVHVYYRISLIKLQTAFIML